jgi:hypothetical protein
MKKSIPLLIILAIAVYSCKTASVPIEVLKPAEINLPGDYKNITVINRSIAGEGSKGGNFVEGLFSGETINQDRNASYNCVNNFAVSINEAPKYVVNFSEDFHLDGIGSDKWPIPIPWDTVKQITDFYKTDILIALETFDTDTRSWSNTRTRDDKTEYIEGIEAIVKTGWRIYDPYKQIIVDQNSFTDRKIWEKSDYNQSSARRKVPNKKEAALDGASYAGYMYAKRISPTWATEIRIYFRTTNEQMKIAHKYVRTNQWKEAYEIWTILSRDENNKTAAYALHNLALYHEFNDNIPMAIKIANQAYSKFPNDHTRNYINILSARESEINRLNQQLDN